MAAAETDLLTDFELDHRAENERFFIDDPAEIAFHLETLAKRAGLATAYLDDGRSFFLTTALAVDGKNGAILIDPPQDAATLSAAQEAHRTTLVASLDRIHLQWRLGKLSPAEYDGRPALAAKMPDTLLRLQRREFFRLEPPAEAPVHCRIRAEEPSGSTIQLQLGDISAGGVSLIAPTEMASRFARDTLFQGCRLDIPEEPVVTADLRVRKTIELSSQDGRCTLRVGCEFVDLRGPRLAVIERYIARIMRERKARTSGLAD